MIENDGYNTPEEAARHRELDLESNPSGWYCELFGIRGGRFVLWPQMGEVPNVFRRWAQWLLLGNRWITEGKR